METGAGDQGRCWYQSPLSVTEEEEGRNREEEERRRTISRWKRGDGTLNKNNATGNTEQKQREGRAQNNRRGPGKGEES